MDTKICSKCGEPKPLTEFYKNRTRKDGLTQYCKECTKKYNGEKDFQKKYKTEHKEEIKEYQKKYAVEHKEEIAERRKNYYQENKEKLREYSKKYHGECGEEIRERQKKYRQKNKEKIRRSQITYKYKVSPSYITRMLIAQDYKCANPGCRAELDNGRKTHIDHSHTTGEVRGILCRNCNVALGQAFDNPEILQGLIEYLSRNK